MPFSIKFISAQNKNEYHLHTILQEIECIVKHTIKYEPSILYMLVIFFHDI
jgi:hypothetical protein